MSYSNVEYFNMLMCLGRSNCNYAAARRDYEVRFSIPQELSLPSERAFQRLHNRMCMSGSVHGDFMHHVNAGRPREHDEIEETILDMFHEDPTRSTRSVARQLGTYHMRVWKALKEDGQHPFHYRRVQALLPADYEARIEYCAWMLGKVEEDQTFLNRVLFTDECSFERTGVFNCHNEHVWSTENPCAKKPSHFQHRWRINVWAGILGDQIIGPYFLNQTMNGTNYLSFLSEQLSELDDLDLDFHRTIWFQHDGAPPHFLRAVRDYLDAQFPRQWIGRGGPIAWPPRSPDLTPLDFYLWGHVKQQVYKKQCNSEVEMRDRIVETFEAIKADTNVMASVRVNLLKRCRRCLHVGGRHVEHDRRSLDEIDVLIH